MKKKTKRKISVFIESFLYLTIVSNILFLTYNILNQQDYSLYFLISSIIISIIPAVFFTNLSNKHFKTYKKIKTDTLGLLIAVPIITLMLLLTSNMYIKIKESKIFKQNEIIYENYEKYYNFDKGTSYRLDADTLKLYYMDEYKLIAIDPIYYYDLSNNEIKVYDLDGKYLIENDGKNYLTNSLDITSELYQVNDKVIKSYETYFITDNDVYKTINDDYKSEQRDNYLYLYKKFNNILYTQEKVYDLRIEVLNEFESSQLAKYNKRTIEIPIGGEVFNLEYSFNDNLEIVYKKTTKD